MKRSESAESSRKPEPAEVTPQLRKLLGGRIVLLLGLLAVICIALAAVFSA